MKFRIVELFKDYFQGNSFVSYVEGRNIEYDVFWFFKNKSGKMFLNKRELIIQEFRCLIILLINAGGFRNKKIVSFGGHYSLLVMTKVFGFLLGPDYHLYIYNFYLHGLGSKKVIKIIMHFLLDTKRTTLFVQSPDELNYFSSLSKNAIHFIPYCEDPGFSVDNSKSIDGDYIFTGGYTNRDYDLILKCARLNPTLKFVLVVSRSNKEINSKDLSDNIVIYEEVDIPTFNGLMEKSYGVIIPLKENVGASGQMLCLGAMKMSKPIIYCDISSINFYFKDTDCGIPYSIGELDSLNEAVHRLYSGEIDIKSMGERAYIHFSENFTLNKRNENILNLILQKLE